MGVFLMSNIPRGEGRANAFLVALKGHQGDECITWPFWRDKYGRGKLQHEGRRYWAHRWMCEMEYGPPPTPAHKATHDCGKGHEGCVNPKHLSWKTQKENLADCWLHGTQGRHSLGPGGKLKPDEVQAIRDLEATHTQEQLATMFNVAEGTINDIWRGRTWNRPHKIKCWSGDEDAKLRAAVEAGNSLPKVSEIVGRPYGAIVGRMQRLGLSCKSGHHACRRP